MDDTTSIEPSTVIGVVVGILVVIFVVVTIARAVRIVPQTVALIIERLGRYSRTLDPGLHFLVPFVDRVRAGVDLREQVVSFRPSRSSPPTTSW